MGVVKIDSMGSKFDPSLHEAVAAEGEGDSEIVSDELQAGYLLDGEIIRPAMVKVERQ